MANFVVTYDLVNRRDYQKIYDAMAEHDAVSLLESVWLISVNNTAAEVRDWLKSLTDNDDKLAVVQIRGGWATYKVDTKANNWLKEHL